MPVENDLTAEERAELSRMGVPDLGEGGEPIREEGQQTQQTEQQTEQQTQHSDRRPNGQFASREEREAAQTQQQTEQQTEQQTQQTEQQTQQPQMVPHAALHAERQRAAAAIAQANLLTQRMNAILRSQQQQTQAESLPDLNDDPEAHIRALGERLARFEQERQQETQFRQIDMGIEQDEMAYAAIAPDYEQASDYYIQSRARELLQFNTPADAQRILTQEARAIATQSWERGMSAAQAVYNLAMARGYNPNASSGNAQQFQQQTGQQQQFQQRGPSAQDVVASVQQSQQQSRSLSGGGAGGQGTQQLNAEAVLNMSDEEFARHFNIGGKDANQRFAAL